jgi:Alpha-L-arabinofuranosidase B, catalytic
MRRLALILALVLIPPTADAFYGARRVLLASKLAAGYSGALDVVSGQAATACYSLRACSVAWATASGKLVEIKRASDSHTCDVLAATAGGFGLTANCSSGGDAGQTASAFCTSTTCTVIDFYDQSGNSLDANVVEHAPTLASTASTLRCRACIQTARPALSQRPQSPSRSRSPSLLSGREPRTLPLPDRQSVALAQMARHRPSLTVGRIRQTRR